MWLPEEKSAKGTGIVGSRTIYCLATDSQMRHLMGEHVGSLTEFACG